MKTLAAALVACAATAVMLDENDLKFVQYMAEHDKNYTSMEEYNIRKARFLELDAEIERLNSSQSDSRHAHNFMSDMTHDEIQGFLLKNVQAPDTSKHPYVPPQTNSTPPDWYSYCYYNRCTYVKNFHEWIDWNTWVDYQPVIKSTTCKASYAFAAISVIETNFAIRENL